MIDVNTEKLISLQEVAKILPPGRGGSRVHLSTLWRWVFKGIRTLTGETVRLEAIRFGGRWITSQEAVQRFVERQTPRLDQESPLAGIRTPGQRQRASERAAKALEKLGI